MVDLTSSQIMMAEARWYWTAMSEMKSDIRLGIIPQQSLYELEGLRTNTDWPLLRERCTAAICSTTPQVTLSDECMA